MLTTNVRTNIRCRSQKADESIHAVMEGKHADAADPIAYKCLRCHLEWEDGPCDSWRTKTCSNCYSDNVVIAKIRLGFQNWGEQNGGAEEQRSRYERAKLQATAPQGRQDPPSVK